MAGKRNTPKKGTTNAGRVRELRVKVSDFVLCCRGPTKIDQKAFLCVNESLLYADEACSGHSYIRGSKQGSTKIHT